MRCAVGRPERATFEHLRPRGETGLNPFEVSRKTRHRVGSRSRHRVGSRSGAGSFDQLRGVGQCKRCGYEGGHHRGGVLRDVAGTAANRARPGTPGFRRGRAGRAVRPRTRDRCNSGVAAERLGVGRGSAGKENPPANPGRAAIAAGCRGPRPKPGDPATVIGSPGVRTGTESKNSSASATGMWRRS
jgi:hypothetical protein